MLVFAVAEAAPLSECARAFRNDEVRGAITSAETVWAALEVDSFRGARGAVQARVSCLGEVIEPTAAGAVHRIEAMEAFLAGDEDALTGALAASLAVDPGYVFPAALVPEGHPIRARIPAASERLREPGVRPLVDAARFVADGDATSAAPAHRAIVLQRLDADGKVVETRYVAPGGDLGDWARANLDDRKAAHPARAPLLVATGLGAAATGVLYALAADKHADFYDDSTPEAEVEALYTATNNLTIGWVGAGVATVGLGAVLVVTW